MGTTTKRGWSVPNAGTNPFYNSMPGVDNPYYTDIMALFNAISVDVDLAIGHRVPLGATTAEIQAILDAYSEVYFPPGTWTVTGSLTLKPGQVVRGAGPGATCIQAQSGTNYAILTYTGPASTVEFISVRNLRLDGQALSNVDGIHIYGNSDANRVSDVRFHNLRIVYTRRAIDLKWCANVWAAMVGMDVSSGAGWEQDQCADVDLWGVRAQNGDGWGFYILGDDTIISEGLRLHQCSTNGQAYGCFISGQRWVGLHGCSFTSCDTGQALYLNSCTHVDVAGGEFGTAIAGSTDGVLVSSCLDVRLHGAFIEGNGSLGIHLNGGSGHSIRDCTLNYNGFEDILLSSVTDSIIEGNHCKSTNDPQSIREQSSCDNNLIRDNKTAGAVEFVGGGTWRRSVPVYVATLTADSNAITGVTLQAFSKSHTLPVGIVNTIGAIVEYEVDGIYSSDASPGSLSIAMRVGGSNFATGALNVPANQTAQPWSFKGRFVVRTLDSGSGATLAPSPSFFWMTGVSSPSFAVTAPLTKGIQSTLLADVRAQFTDDGNSITMRTFTVKVYQPVAAF